MLLKLKRRFHLVASATLCLKHYLLQDHELRALTSVDGLNGGPDAIAGAVVPGRIRLSAPCADFSESLPSRLGGSAVVFNPGDIGPLCTSVKGGGLGRRGFGDTAAIALDSPSASKALPSATTSTMQMWRLYFFNFSTSTDLKPSPGNRVWSPSSIVPIGEEALRCICRSRNA